MKAVVTDVEFRKRSPETNLRRDRTFELIRANIKYLYPCASLR